MRFRPMTALACAVLVPIAACGSPDQDTAGTSTIRCSTSSPVDGGDYLAVKTFADAVDAKTDGKVEVKIFPDSQLGDYESVLQQIRAGSVDCLYESIGTLGTISPLASIEAVPYLYPDVEAFFEVWDGDIGAQILSDVEEATELHLEGPAFRGFRQLAVNESVQTASDLDGLKLRVPAIPAYVDAFKALGAQPTPLPFPETYAAIQQGIVVGVENSLTGIRDQKFNEVTDNLVLTNHMAETMAFVFQSAAFKDYDEDTKTAIQEAAADSAKWYRKYTEENESKILEDFADKGMKIVEPDLDEFRNLVRDYDPGPDLRPYVEQIRELVG